MKIRQATLADAAALAQLERLQPRSAGWGQAGFAGEFSQAASYIWCVQEQDKVIGFVAARAAADQSEILNIAVHPHWTGKGIGFELLRHVFNQLRAQGVRHISLEAAADNLAANRLYAKAGMKVCAVRKNFYPAGQDGQIWAIEW